MQATAGQEVYVQNRLSYYRHYKFLEIYKFIAFVDKQVLGENHWSLDVRVGYATKNNSFARNKMV